MAPDRATTTTTYTTTRSTHDAQDHSSSAAHAAHRRAAFVVALVASALFMATSDATAQDPDPTSTVEAKGVCGQSFHPFVRGGEAYWTLSCSGNKITMTGWVKDTKADGKCAYVKAIFANGDSPTPAKACPKGDETSFSWSGPGRLANGYLYVR